MCVCADDDDGDDDTKNCYYSCREYIHRQQQLVNKKAKLCKRKKQHQAEAWVAHMSQIILNDASENWIFLLCDDQYKVQL